MRLADFEDLIHRMTAEVPEHFLDGISAIEVSPKTIPHPTRADVYTMGECIPEPGADEAGPSGGWSRIALYHGSFRALAGLDPEFDWREEAWETLTHELRHHLEWRARTDALEDVDRAAEQNFARHDGESYDPLFFLDGEEVGENTYQVDDDVFIDHVIRRVPPTLRFGWHGRRYEADLPATVILPIYLSVDGLDEPPPGELILVLRKKPSLLDLFGGAELHQGKVQARALA